MIPTRTLTPCYINGHVDEESDDGRMCIDDESDEPDASMLGMAFNNFSLHESGELDNSILGMAFHLKGISGVHRSGEQVNLLPSTNMLARLAFPLSSTELLLFHKSLFMSMSL